MVLAVRWQFAPPLLLLLIRMKSLSFERKGSGLLGKSIPCLNSTEPGLDQSKDSVAAAETCWGLF